ncbi:excinuclease ABC subunit UvrC [Alkalibacter saccharofermentans]|uniref:UvrABC system protein C n=1 Tax=Alkalibacter saccharofermentans DSM 14828 TaxID=1120975 RepID=A0A1M4U9J8_9FIRM|nr:excinuclease ABC subunit UvrC [Alkalibacter saccharofermentans]SHE53328.1 Excinuclease ABC subunit C [Alkalibacter saccharofermentans DSM 14828]
MINEKLKDLPDKPGVYLMKNSENQIIYVGKAKNLKNRVKQYFQKNSSHGLKVLSMVRNIEDFEIIVTDNEIEALILEYNLIKKHRPRYNILLKDDKSYPYIKVTLNEQYPRVMMTRNVKKDGGRYFGPYTSASAVKQTVEAIHQTYKLKVCNKKFDNGNNNQRPCLNYYIHRCPGVCTGTVDRDEYMRSVGEIIEILKGKDKIIVDKLSRDMAEASVKLDFETAAKLRDQIQGIKAIGEKQKIILDIYSDQDVVNYTAEGKDICIQVFNIRDGKMLGRETHMIELDASGEDVLNQFVKQFYHSRSMIPKEIIIPQDIEDRETIETWLREKKGSKVSITVPFKGDKKKLLSMVEENAKIALFEHLNKKFNKNQAESFCGKWLVENLGLSEYPQRIESYDISNISGKDAVGGMVVFQGFKSDKKAYRRFRIKSVEGQDDFASTQEIIFRRIERGLREMGKKEDKSSFLPFPQVILLDGGLGHLNAAKKIVDMYDLDITLCGMVKNDKHKLEKLVIERGVVEIPPATPIYYFLNEISEEVHRFAVEYHRKLRSDGLKVSELSKIQGIGHKRQRLLLEHFRSLEKIKRADLNELKKVKGIDSRTAESIYQYFKKDSNNADSDKNKEEEAH